MADAENPLVPIQTKVIKIRTRLIEFQRKVMVKIRAMVNAYLAFAANVRKSAKELALAVGKAAVDQVLRMGTNLINVILFAEKQLIEALKLSTRILKTIKSGLNNPSKVFKAVKAMVARLAKLYRIFVSLVLRSLAYINPVERALYVIDSMRIVLQMVFRWMTQVSPLAKMVKLVRAQLKKYAALLKAEGKIVTELVKEANRLKPA